jgi:hypothetical protein
MRLGQPTLVSSLETQDFAFAPPDIQILNRKARQDRKDEHHAWDAA